MPAAQSLQLGARRPARIAALTLLGRPALRSTQNILRGELLAKVARKLKSRPGWSNLDALLAPAGLFRSDQWYGHSPTLFRLLQADEEDFADVARAAALRLQPSSPGCLVVVGVDSRRPGRGFRGDQMVVAFNYSGAIGLARKSFPVDGDTNGWGRAPYLLFEQDGHDDRRFVTLANGERAMLHACYDAFGLTELRIGPTHKRQAFRWAGDEKRWWRWFEPGETDRWLRRWAQAIEEHAPSVNLVSVHGFERPGGEVYWQRHGIATASAALGGALTVGAAHYAEFLPEGWSSPLASRGVKDRHLFEQCHRRARTLAPIDHFYVTLRARPSLYALVRLFQGA